MKALVFSRKPAKFAAAMVAGRLSPGGGAKVGPLSLRDVDPPELPGPGWVRLRPRLSGICGSDLATIDGISYVVSNEATQPVIDAFAVGRRFPR